MDLSSLGLLVLLHYLSHLLDGIRAVARNVAVPQVVADLRLQLCRIVAVIPVVTVGKLRRQDHAHRNRLAVGHAFREALLNFSFHVLCRRFPLLQGFPLLRVFSLREGLDRMGECVSEVQFATLVLLELVTRDDSRLHPRRS